MKNEIQGYILSAVCKINTAIYNFQNGAVIIALNDINEAKNFVKSAIQISEINSRFQSIK